MYIRSYLEIEFLDELVTDKPLVNFSCSFQNLEVLPRSLGSAETDGLVVHQC